MQLQSYLLATFFKSNMSHTQPRPPLAKVFWYQELPWKQKERINCFLGNTILQLVHQQNGSTIFNLEVDFPVFLPGYVYTEKTRDHVALTGINDKSFYVQDINGIMHMELHFPSFKG